MMNNFVPYNLSNYSRFIIIFVLFCVASIIYWNINILILYWGGYCGYKVFV